MSERIKNYKRRSISIPIELDAIIEYKFKSSGHSFINDLIIELLELELVKYEDNFEIKDLLYEIKNEIKNIEMNKGFNGS